VVAVGLALALTACGGSDRRPGPVGSSLSGAGAFDAHRRAPAAPIKGAVAGGTVTVLVGRDALGHAGSDQVAPQTMDPTGSYFNSTSAALNGLVARSLTQYVYDSKTESMVLVPDLATDLGTPNTDFTQWTFTIRRGVRFEDGSPVSAEDVAFGIKRSFDRTDFPDGPSYSNDYFLDGDSYQGPYLSGTDYPGVVVDGNRLTIKMARAFPDMQYWAAFAAMGPIPARGSDPATYWRHPLATGPYKFGRYLPGKSLTLVRNEQWDPTTDPGRHAYPDRYVFKFFQDPARSEATMLGDSPSGRTTLSYDDVSLANRSRARQRGRITTGPGPCTGMFWPDNRKITDIRVREALGYAFPYREMAALGGGVLGVTTIPGASILPEGLPGRQDYTVLDAAPGQTDPHRARMLLRRAGYAPGDYTIAFAYSESQNSPFGVAQKDLLVTSLHAAGFATQPIVTPNAEGYFSVLWDPHAPINVRLGGWCNDWPSGSSWLPHFYASRGDRNDAYFAEPSVDKAIQRIAALPLEEQPSAWGALDKEVMTRYYPGVVLSYSTVQMVHGADIGGMNDDQVLGMPTWKDLYVRR
jgi:peptide/nickel transport system substrate-binding protein